MARERMAKLIKYDHFEGIIGHIITYFMSSQIFMFRSGPKMGLIRGENTF